MLLKLDIENCFTCDEWKILEEVFVFFNIFFLYEWIFKTKLKVETQNYTSNINLYREITSTKIKHSNLLVSVVLLFINQHHRQTNKGEKQKQKIEREKITKINKT